jgi:flavodoxin
MRITLYYFSGTGNTAWVVRRLTEVLTGCGHEVNTRSCETFEADVAPPVSADMLGLAFPTASSYAPTVFREFIVHLPEVAALPLFAITTAGYASGDTAWFAVQPLRARGYEPFLLANVLMPNNFYITPVPRRAGAASGRDRRGPASPA